MDYDNQGGSLTFGKFTTAAQIGGLKGSQNLSLVNTASTGVALSVGGNNESTTYSGVFSGTGGSVNKEGTGTFTVTGNNTHTGGTTVSKGTFLANNTAGSATGTGSVNTVSGSGATLGGTGSITGGASQNITLGAGTFLMVGGTHGVNSGGAQDLVLGNSSSVTNVDINLAGTLQFDLFGNDGSGVSNPLGENDALKLFSSVTVDLTGSSLEVAALGMDPLTWNIGDTWMLIDLSGVTNPTKLDGSRCSPACPRLLRTRSGPATRMRAASTCRSLPCPSLAAPCCSSWHWGRGACAGGAICPLDTRYMPAGFASTMETMNAPRPINQTSASPPPTMMPIQAWAFPRIHGSRLARFSPLIPKTSAGIPVRMPMQGIKEATAR